MTEQEKKDKENFQIFLEAYLWGCIAGISAAAIIAYLALNWK